jgi:hypothetical protein
MSITATTNYMSSFSINEWMEEKTEGLYGQMGNAMDVSNDRADAEQELNHINSMLADAKNNGSCDVVAVKNEIDKALSDYKDVPELVQALNGISHGISLDADASSSSTPGVAQSGVPIQAGTSATTIKASSADIDGWTKSITDTVDGLGKKDQLGLINIQEFNSEINQAQQIASALMDSSSKTDDNIISHIG